MWNDLLADARWAPSPHNLQPWLLRPVSETEAELLYDPARLLPMTDPGGRFMCVGLGIFAETLAVSARARGKDVVAEFSAEPLDPGRSDPGVFARLSLVDHAGGEDLDRRLIVARRTSRVAYDGRPADPAAVAELAAEAARGGHRLELTSDDETVAWILELNRKTAFYDLTDPVARGELGRWLRFSGAEARSRADGFSPDALGFPGPLLRLFFHRHRLFELPLVRTVRDRLYMRAMRGTRSVGWIVGPFETQEDWIAAGRMLARLWLRLTKHGLVLHPFGSVITNERSNAEMRQRLAVDDGTPWLLFRCGYSAEPPRSYRLEADALLRP